LLACAVESMKTPANRPTRPVANNFFIITILYVNLCANYTYQYCFWQVIKKTPPKWGFLKVLMKSGYYSIIFDTTPAPTVLPPSRIANLNPSSIAICVINSTLNVALSPGITISVPSSNLIAPVTSVVLK